MKMHTVTTATGRPSLPLSRPDSSALAVLAGPEYPALRQARLELGFIAFDDSGGIAVPAQSDTVDSLVDEWTHILSRRAVNGGGLSSVFGRDAAILDVITPDSRESRLQLVRPVIEAQLRSFFHSVPDGASISAVQETVVGLAVSDHIDRSDLPRDHPSVARTLDALVEWLPEAAVRLPVAVDIVRQQLPDLLELSSLQRLSSLSDDAVAYGQWAGDVRLADALARTPQPPSLRRGA